MDLSELKKRLADLEVELDANPVVDFWAVETPSGKMSVAITNRFRKCCRKGRVWKTHAMLAALKNTQYGLDRNRPRSRGGADGVFLLDRTFHPPNEMMRKIFDRFLDKPDPLVDALAMRFSTPARDFVPVRVVSHDMRLLGVLLERNGTSQLVLVHYDDTKDG